jgi:hypothetical protein
MRHHRISARECCPDRLKCHHPALFLRDQLRFCPLARLKNQKAKKAHLIYSRVLLVNPAPPTVSTIKPFALPVDARK